MELKKIKGITINEEEFKKFFAYVLSVYNKSDETDFEKFLIENDEIHKISVNKINILERNEDKITFKDNYEVVNAKILVELEDYKNKRYLVLEPFVTTVVVDGEVINTCQTSIISLDTQTEIILD